jgi:hypothetical protein
MYIPGGKTGSGARLGAFCCTGTGFEVDTGAWRVSCWFLGAVVRVGVVFDDGASSNAVAVASGNGGRVGPCWDAFSRADGAVWVCNNDVACSVANVDVFGGGGRAVAWWGVFSRVDGAVWVGVDAWCVVFSAGAFVGAVGADGVVCVDAGM